MGGVPESCPQCGEFIGLGMAYRDGQFTHYCVLCGWVKGNTMKCDDCENYEPKKEWPFCDFGPHSAMYAKAYKGKHRVNFYIVGQDATTGYVDEATMRKFIAFLQQAVGDA